MSILDWSYRPTQAEPVYLEQVQRYEVGIRFTHLVGPNESSDKNIGIKHWALVFSPLTTSSMHHTIEIFPNLKDNVAIRHEKSKSSVSSYIFAFYRGSPDDIERILEAHPMRRTRYHPCFNNCQHFAATFLILLRVYTHGSPDRSFKILDPSRMRQVLSVLGGEDLKLYNKPNMQMQSAGLSLSSRAAADLTQAAGATETYTVQKGGIAGWFEAIKSVIAPAASAPLAAASVPLAVGVGAAYGWHQDQSKINSAFKDPMTYGFPKGKQSLTREDYMQQDDLENIPYKDSLIGFRF
jgi:hypothetical protein